MATPANPLDKYVTYNYHFELHAVTTHKELSDKGLSVDPNSTTRFASKGSLLINTIKDAHQTIDEVHIECFAPATSKTGVTDGLGIISMVIKEPGSFAFIEKLQTKANELKILDMQNILFGLRIIFVGRTPTNQIDTLVEPIIPMVLSDMSGTFTEEGGVYQLTFIPTEILSTSRTTSISSLPAGYNFVNKAITFQATTIEEALAEFQNKLNDNYEHEYSKYVDANGMRKVKYKITFDPEVKGPVIGPPGDKFVKGGPKSFSMDPKKQISAQIMDMILTRCPTLADKIGEGKKGTTTRFNEGSFHPIIVPSVLFEKDYVEIHYQVKIYKGGKGKKGPFVFNYYFSEAGKNVDVMGFEIKFDHIAAWLGTRNTVGLDKFVGQCTPITPKRPEITSAMLQPNITQPSIESQVEKSVAPGLSGDIARLPSAIGKSSNGIPYEHIPSITLAADSMTNFSGAISFSPTVEIRGHKDILDICISEPTSSEGILVGDGVWVKLNIFMPDGNIGEQAKKKEFYYTGYYRILTISNVFSGGLFKQSIQLIANEVDLDGLKAYIKDNTAPTSANTPYRSASSSQSGTW